jgi:hypothetical protein
MFDNAHSGAPQKKAKKEDGNEMDERTDKSDGKGKGKEDEAQEEMDGWSDLETEDLKKGSKSRNSLCQRVWQGKLLDGKKQMSFEPKFKEKEVKEIINLIYKEQELENFEENDGRKCVFYPLPFYCPSSSSLVRGVWRINKGSMRDVLLVVPRTPKK